jgi:hypothetical protein
VRPNIISLINAALLIGLGSWGYIDSGREAFTALIPVFVGIILVVMNPGVKKENKIAAHIAVLLTLLILIGLIKPFIASLEREDLMATLRVGLMMASTVWAMVSFIQSFRAARKARKA